MNEPLWMDEARRCLGVAEVPGVKTSPLISQWLRRLKAWWADDETPWCGVFVAQCLEATGYAVPTYWMRARAWLDWGVVLMAPVVGCVVIFERPGGGHVGFVVGKDARGRLLVLGGNQGNKVSIVPFDRNRVVGYRWPASRAVPGAALAELPVLSWAAGASSRDEA